MCRSETHPTFGPAGEFDIQTSPHPPESTYPPGETRHGSMTHDLPRKSKRQAIIEQYFSVIKNEKAHKTDAQATLRSWV